MRNITLILLVMIVGTLNAGCGPKASDMALCRPELTPALLFDRYAGAPAASGLRYRTDWPATPAVYQLGESISYRERFLDIQRGGASGHGRMGYTYRRFDTVRTGRAVR